MYFLARSAVCIGLIAVAASQAGAGTVGPSLGRDARDAASTAARACSQMSECIALGAGILSAAAVPMAAVGTHALDPRQAPMPQPGTIPRRHRPARSASQREIHDDRRA